MVVDVLGHLVLEELVEDQTEVRLIRCWRAARTFGSSVVSV